MTLYEMTEAAQRLYELLQEEEIDEDVVNDTLEAMDVGSKLEDYCKLIRQFQSDAEALKSEEDKLHRKRERAEKTADRLSNNILRFLKSANREREKAGVFEVAVRKSEAVRILNLQQIPESYLRTKTTTEPDKARIKKALKSGAEITGAEIAINEKISIR
ncbi:siphovirus Gp157 family protein [Yeguia hominis]|uniref:Siphovirus Gp157 family protein n=1 Tax=Yeguia hominis TaxID=2763662 RepID=A0A926HT70_9FIRM|nr:siphovirus Gp157 family protein [Yeguia hominis]MBC8534575.1 siphovirus Gp157 family protein [Yeguia hominis]